MVTNARGATNDSPGHGDPRDSPNRTLHDDAARQGDDGNSGGGLGDDGGDNRTRGGGLFSFEFSGLRTRRVGVGTEMIPGLVLGSDPPQIPGTCTSSLLTVVEGRLRFLILLPRGYVSLGLRCRLRCRRGLVVVVVLLAAAVGVILTSQGGGTARGRR
jgi:hypothetical protein